MAGKADLVNGIVAEHGEFPWRLSQASSPGEFPWQVGLAGTAGPVPPHCRRRRGVGPLRRMRTLTRLAEARHPLPTSGEGWLWILEPSRFEWDDAAYILLM